MNQAEFQESQIIRAKYNNDTVSNGGVPNLTNVVVSSNLDNYFTSVPNAQRVAGVTRLRKFGHHHKSEFNSPVNIGYMYMYYPTAGEDKVYMFKGNFTETQADVDLISKRMYGVGFLNATANPADTTIEVAVEDGADNIYQIGDKVVIGRVALDNARLEKGVFLYDAAEPILEETVEVTGVATAGDVVTLTLATGLNNTFESTQVEQVLNGNTVITEWTYVASMMPMTDDVDVNDNPVPLQAEISDVVVTSSNADPTPFDETLVELDSRGVIYDNWTLEFVTQTTFSIQGLRTGVITGGGSVNSDTSPINPATNTPYFTIPATATNGSYEAGDTITFVTKPHIANFWLIHIVPAGATAPDSSLNMFLLRAVGQ